MAEQERPRGGGGGQGRSGPDRGRGQGGSGRGGSGRDGRGRPQGRDQGGRSQGRDERGRSQGRDRGDAPQGGPRRERGPRTGSERRVDQAEYDGPPLPEDVTGRELDRSVSSHLRGLPEKLASRVARHLVAAGLVLAEDPETAYRHCLAARARAPRLAVVREATGEAAYHAGHFAEALSELRAAKRMNGSSDFLHVMADCHRALGHPERALELAKSPAVQNFDSETRAEMVIVEAGARRDLGQLDAALRVLELAPLNTSTRAPWVSRLRYAYADMLEAAGRETDALEWFHRTEGVDGDEVTDAAARAAALEERGVGGA